MFFQMPMQMAVEREIHRYFRQLVRRHSSATQTDPPPLAWLAW